MLQGTLDQCPRRLLTRLFWKAAAVQQAVERDASNDSFCSTDAMCLQWLAARHTSTRRPARCAPVPQRRGSAGLPPSPCPRGQSARCCRGGPPGPAGCSRGSLQGREREGRVQVSAVCQRQRYALANTAVECRSVCPIRHRPPYEICPHVTTPQTSSPAQRTIDHVHKV